MADETNVSGGKAGGAPEEKSKSLIDILKE